MAKRSRPQSAMPGPGADNGGHLPGRHAHRAGRGQCCEVHTRKTVFFLASSVLLRGGRAARTGERLPVPVS